MKRHKIIFIFLLISLFFISACGQSSNSKNASELKWKNGHGDLSDHIGDKYSTFNNTLPPPSYFGDNKDLLENTPYNDQTGVWFFYNGSGKFGYGLPSGTMNALDPFDIQLIEHDNKSVQIDRNVRIQLTEWKEDFDPTEAIIDEVIYLDSVKNNEIIFTGELPEAENTSYLLSVEMMNGETVEDTLVSWIYVPKHEMNVFIRTDQQSYSESDEKANLIIENFGPTFLLLDTYYTIEKKVDDIWKVVPLDLAFDDIALYLYVNDDYTQQVFLNDLTPGDYRIIKNVAAAEIGLSTTLAAEFSIE